MSDDKSKALRNKIFFSLFLICGITFGVNDYINLIDECLLAYIIIIIAGLISLFFSSWWWFYCGKATDVFKWLMTLIAGIVIALSVNLYARILFLQGKIEDYNQFITCGIWKYRMVLEAIALLYILSLMLARLLNENKDIK